MESAGVDSGFRRNDGWESWYDGWGRRYDGEYVHTA